MFNNCLHNKIRQSYICFIAMLLLHKQILHNFKFDFFKKKKRKKETGGYNSFHIIGMHNLMGLEGVKTNHSSFSVVMGVENKLFLKYDTIYM